MRLGYGATFPNPGRELTRVQRAKGYRFVLVNGEVTIEEDRELGRYSGQMLR